MRWQELAGERERCGAGGGPRRAERVVAHSHHELADSGLDPPLPPAVLVRGDGGDIHLRKRERERACEAPFAQVGEDGCGFGLVWV